MGLIKAALGAAGGVMADQWKEYFYCEAIPETTLAVKGQHRVSGRSSNYKGSENIISNGSVVAVADGQCMIIVDQGKVTELCAEPGEFVYDSSTEPSIFSGQLGTSIVDTFKNIGKRFTFGGEPPKDQRVYYFNTKELIGNKYGTPSTSTLPSAAFVNTATASATRSCSTRTSAAMWVRIIPATGWTDSSRPSYLPRFSPRLRRFPTWASAIPRSPAIQWSWPRH